ALGAVAILYVRRGARRSDGAVALADQILRRRPAVVGLEIDVDELTERAQVARLPVELLRAVARRRAAVAGGNRVDEHEIADVDQRVLVVLERVRRRRLKPLVGHPDALRRERSHVQPDRGGARTAVVEKRYRSRLRVFSVF